MARRNPEEEPASEQPADRAGASGLDKVLNYGRRLLQPQYWPELRRFALRRLSGRPMDENTAEMAQRRSAEMAISRQEAIVALGLPGDALRSFAADHPARLEAAEMRVNAARGGMGGGADIDLLYSLCIAFNATRVLETGVAFGWSSLAILSAIAPRDGARLVSIDLPYLGANLDNLVGLAVPDNLRDGWHLRRGADRDELAGAIGEVQPMDIAHYDSDKSYLGRLWAYPLIWEGLREGGLLISDDVEDNLAFLDFAAAAGIEPLVVQAPQRARLSGILRKV